MRRCLLAFMLVLAAVGGLVPAARADTDPVSTWYQQVTEWRGCIRGVIAVGGTIDAARTKCGARPEPPADPRLERFRQAIKVWRICIREQLAKGVHGDALRVACPMPMLADFGLPKPPEPPKLSKRAEKTIADAARAVDALPPTVFSLSRTPDGLTLELKQSGLKSVSVQVIDLFVNSSLERVLETQNPLRP